MRIGVKAMSWMMKIVENIKPIITDRGPPIIRKIVSKIK
jgi:hypothetical protein